MCFRSPDRHRVASMSLAHPSICRSTHITSIASSLRAYPSMFQMTSLAQGRTPYMVRAKSARVSMAVSASVTEERENSYRLVVEDMSTGEEKTRLDAYLASQLKQYSRSFLSDLCDQGSVTVNKKPKGKNFKVKIGDAIELAITPKEATSVTPENIPLNILFEDDDIIIVNKPPGMVVHPAPGSPNNTFVNALLFHLGAEAGQSLINGTATLGLASGGTARMQASMPSQSWASDMNDDIDEEDIVALADGEGIVLDLPETPQAAVATPVSLRPGIVHRLDKGTSGVLIAGKHTDAVAKLSKLFFLRQIRKVYLAICVGHPGEATVVEPIGRCHKNRQLMTVYDGPPGKTAISHIRTLAFDGKMSAALVRIETGRTHQIRVHLKARRTPIIGDEDYGNKDWNKRMAQSNAIKRPLLHAYETEFEHPFTGETIIIRAPVPDDMAGLLKLLSNEGNPILDSSTAFLIGSTDVQGKLGDGQKGFVPMDRLMFEEEDYTSFSLPESEEELLRSGFTL
jgi:23S rRNA pseudouridine1911/1915/1917 synthase